MIRMPTSELPRSPRRTRQPDRRPTLLAALHDAGHPLDVAEAAAAIGTTELTARFHLSLLVSSGQVVRTPVRRGSAGRPSWQYAPAPEPAATGSSPAPSTAESYQALARVLAASLDDRAGAAAAAREAGWRWADAVPAEALAPAADAAGAVDELAGVLERLGFAPEPAPADDEIVLRSCPFEAVAREHRSIVCGVHLGLVEQAAASIGGGIAIEGLEPFRTDRPLTCAVRLRQAS